MSLTVEPVRTRRDRRDFIRFPFRLYAGDPNWVPPLILEVREKLDPRRHPFFRHGEVELFLARCGDRVAGRVAAVVDRKWNEAQPDSQIGFGLIEFENDAQIAAALLRAVAEHGRSLGLTVLRGPLSFSTNEECSTLIEGFDSPPVIMMAYNPPWYPQVFERLGLQKTMDMFAYYMDDTFDYSRIHRIADRAMNRHPFVIREVDMGRFDEEVGMIRKIFNESWKDNWGFVPIDEVEFRYHAGKLRQAIEPRLAYVAEFKDQPVGFMITLPDFNELLKRMGGRLFPFGLLKYLFYRRRIDGLRVVLMATLPEHRQLGVEAAMISRTITVGKELHYTRVELSWVLESNTPMRNLAERIGARPYKKYRIWEAPVERLLSGSD